MDSTTTLSGKLLPKTELKHGYYYEGRCRSDLKIQELSNGKLGIHRGKTSVGRWDSTKQHFVHTRARVAPSVLHADRSPFQRLRHPEDEKCFDVFKPIKELGEEGAGVEIPFI